jgi:two-component sensor histidine kinase/CheY-like chemotaxis protein
MIAIPVSRAPSDYLMLFRRELIRKVTWAGEPEKAVASDGQERLSPRRSFAAWQDEVRGEAEYWTPVDLRIAERYRATVLEVILRFSDAAETERKRTQERQELLIAELNHRVRNILTLIRGLIKQSHGSASSLKKFTLMLGGRIEALARAHDQITVDRWDAAPLRSMIDAEAKAFLLEKSDHVVMEGPPVLLEPQAFSTLTLVIHELITNAAKYGALCDSSGRVHVNWTIDSENNVRLSWVEEGGPPVQAPSRRGFGSTIIEHSIPFDLKGTSEVDYALSGVRVEIMIPGHHVKPADAEQMGRRQAVGEDAADHEPLVLHGHALLVEDTMIVALDAEDMLLALGISTVDVASSVNDAFRLIKTTRPTLALLDINLGSETSFPVARRLIEEGIPFVFATGYGDDVALPDAYSDIPIVKKPYNAETILAQLTHAIRRAVEPLQDGSVETGSSFTASPDQQRARSATSEAGPPATGVAFDEKEASDGSVQGG